MPKRIQRKRTKGWRMPPNTVYVGRPSLWGNPFVADKKTSTVRHLDGKEVVLNGHRILAWWDGPPRDYLKGCFSAWIKLPQQKTLRAEIRKNLRGKNLACWCPLGQPCHADVLLEIANSDT